MLTNSGATHTKYAIEVPFVKVCVSRDPSSVLRAAELIKDSASLHRLVSPFFEGADREHMLLLCLDAKYQPVAAHVVSTGSLTLCIVHPREVFKAAVLSNAAAIVLAHNHPSGDPTPSPEDRELTGRLQECGDLMGIRLLDHLVVGDGTYVSFADQGWISHKADGR